jgi:hypothetical protein
MPWPKRQGSGRDARARPEPDARHRRKLLDELDRNLLGVPSRFPGPHLRQRHGIGRILASLDQSIVIAAADNRGVIGQGDRLHHDRRYTLPLVSPKLLWRQSPSFE